MVSGTRLGVGIRLRAAAYSADNPVLGDIGRYTVAEVLADFEQTHS